LTLASLLDHGGVSRRRVLGEESFVFQNMHALNFFKLFLNLNSHTAVRFFCTSVATCAPSSVSTSLSRVCVGSLDSPREIAL
jgi:hypothetical protein